MLEVTGHQELVFCNTQGELLRYNNVNKRMWYPRLAYLGLERLGLQLVLCNKEAVYTWAASQLENEVYAFKSIDDILGAFLELIEGYEQKIREERVSQ